jgi:anti-anti-sigma regulatory factor
MLTIQLGAVLRDALPTPSRDLVTRPTGAAVRLRILRTLAETPGPAARLDFADVGLVDGSCADEVVAKLLREMEAGCDVVLCNLDEAQADAIDHVLARQGLAVVAATRDGGVTLLGRTTPEQLTVFRAVQEAGPGDVVRLAAFLSWTPERTADALRSLALLRLVRAAGGTFSPLPIP